MSATPATTVHVEADRRGTGWRVVLRRGDLITVVGTHAARFRADEQARQLRGDA